MKIIGIDPGLNGAFSIVNGKEAYGFVMPVNVQIRKKQKNRRILDTETIVEFLENELENDYFIVYIEKQQAMPMMRKTNEGILRQGITSTFNTGYGYGILIGILEALHIDYVAIHPKTWQKSFFTRDYEKSTKEQALEVATVLFKNTDFRKSKKAKKAHDGIVDALLIAEYGLRNEENGRK